MADKKIAIKFTVVTFMIAYVTADSLIFFEQFGYRVYNVTNTFEQFAANIPFSICILSPAIASFFVFKKNNRITGMKECWNVYFAQKTAARPVYLLHLG